MCGSFIHKVSNMETTSTNHDDHDATYKQAPEIMRAVKTRKERNQSSLGYSTMWENIVELNYKMNSKVIQI